MNTHFVPKWNYFLKCQNTQKDRLPPGNCSCKLLQRLIPFKHALPLLQNGQDCNIAKEICNLFQFTVSLHRCLTILPSISIPKMMNVKVRINRLMEIMLHCLLGLKSLNTGMRQNVDDGETMNCIYVYWPNINQLNSHHTLDTIFWTVGMGDNTHP